MNVLHYGHYLDNTGGPAEPPTCCSTSCSNNENCDGQLGYMEDPHYPTLPSPEPSVKASIEFLVLGEATTMLGALEPELTTARPQVVVSPAHFGCTTTNGLSGQTFAITDTDGDVSVKLLRITRYQGATVLGDQYFSLTSSSLFNWVQSGSTRTYSWVTPPTLLSGSQYRFTLSAIDSEGMWDIDSANYEIP
jgi:hypothetical protein